MKAKQKTLLLLVALAAALGLCLWMLTRANAQAEQDAAGEESIPVSSFAVEELTGIVYSYNGETVALDYDGESWTLADDPSYHISQSLCNTMASALCALNAKRSLEAGAGQDYGVDTPLVAVTVTAAGETNTLRFGDVNGITGDIYLQKEGDDAVYTVSASKAGCFEYGKEDLFEPFNPAGLTRSALEEIRYERLDGEETVSVRLKAVSEAAETEEAESDSTEYATVWRLADDPSAELDGDKLDALLSALGASVTGQITAPGALGLYGLETPQVTVWASTADKEVCLSYGIGVDGYYMRVEGDPSVYRVDGSTVEAFSYRGDELTD